MLRPPRVGAYSNKYKRAELDKPNALGYEAAPTADLDDTRTKELRKEANLRRRCEAFSITFSCAGSLKEKINFSEQKKK